MIIQRYGSAIFCQLKKRKRKTRSATVDKNAKEQNSDIERQLYYMNSKKRTQANSYPSVLLSPPSPRPLDKSSIPQILTSNERNNALCHQFKINKYCKKPDILYARPLCTTWCNLFNARNLVA